ncbi:MAG: NUDIX domain-containing protein [Novosphingobium sp.]|nr:NUDIX domain-containing protein [Novosphingobium sp.]
MIARVLPAPLHRLGLRVAHALRKRYWRWRRPLLVGCSVMVFRVADGGQRSVLLVRHSYGSGRWGLPGGAVARGEDPASAALRELREEVGLDLDALHLVGSVVRDLHGARNQLEMFSALSNAEPQIDGREIVAAGYFPLDALPPDLAGDAMYWLRYQNSES